MRIRRPVLCTLYTGFRTLFQHFSPSAAGIITLTALIRRQTFKHFDWNYIKKNVFLNPPQYAYMKQFFVWFGYILFV